LKLGIAALPGLGDLDYPLHDWAATVTKCGRICLNHRKLNLSQLPGFAWCLGAIGLRLDYVPGPRVSEMLPQSRIVAGWRYHETRGREPQYYLGEPFGRGRDRSRDT